MSLIKYEETILVSSDPELGAINQSLDGSSFEVQFETPISIPKDALGVTITSEESTVWWTVPNIIDGENNKFYIFGDSNDPIPVPQLFTVTIPQGLYDLPGLNNSLLTQLENLGAKTVPSPLINLLADENTQKVLIRVNYTNVTVDFTPTDTSRVILGFNSQVLGPFGFAPLNVLADNTAEFNTVNYFLIGCDIVSQGLRFNNTYANIVSQVLIDKPPGSQIISTPINPSRISSDELAGQKRTNIRVFLTDDKLRPVNTNSEYFSTRLVIRYSRIV